jgi:hypothetical protein
MQSATRGDTSQLHRNLQLEAIAQSPCASAQVPLIRVFPAVLNVSLISGSRQRFEASRC